MGGIDLDPCTSAEFNQIVRASRILTIDDNALIQTWERGIVRMLIPLEGIKEAPDSGSRVFINPPGGLVTEFWDKLLAEIEAGNVSQAVWIGFSVEQLCQLASHACHPMDFSNCIVRKRISFTREDGYHGSPSHGNYITGIGVDHTKFEQAFGDIGKVTRGSLAV